MERKWETQKSRDKKHYVENRKFPITSKEHVHKKCVVDAGCGGNT
jgi:hypothetical protein